eukprot:TRINITY_DN42589_c1_g2_i1.p1 TRINITY_DN42589_c1_g2~~TRINITY_DN42589_c1_g2_i1.p1  ORF type:complete len:156 (+),score=17.56 TRINITY_DN42589_c1_g2_i1:288-755(+)
MPFRFDAPRMIATSRGEMLLFARYARDPYQFMPTSLPLALQRAINLIRYSLQHQGAAVYRLEPPHIELKGWPAANSGRREDCPLQLLRCFENAFGDTGFFSLASDLTTAGADNWIVCNYASTLCHSHAPWLYAQFNPTDVFVSRCRVVGVGAPAK